MYYFLLCVSLFFYDIKDACLTGTRGGFRSPSVMLDIFWCAQGDIFAHILLKNNEPMNICTVVMTWQFFFFFFFFFF